MTPETPNTTDPAPLIVHLDDASIQALATRVVELITTRNAATPVPEVEEADSQLLSASQVATRWNLDRSWVYRHADELGAIQLGTGTRPRLRYDPAKVEHIVAAGRSHPGPTSQRRVGRQERRGSHKIVRNDGDLLPIVGEQSYRQEDPK